jgi:hypothetical protein
MDYVENYDYIKKKKEKHYDWDVHFKRNKSLWYGWFQKAHPYNPVAIKHFFVIVCNEGHILYNIMYMYTQIVYT